LHRSKRYGYLELLNAFNVTGTSAANKQTPLQLIKINMKVQ